PPPLGEETHYAGLRHGMIWTESGTAYGQLPATGAFYCLLAPKVVNGVGAAGRAFGIVGDPLAARLIESARSKRAVDLSVELTEYEAKYGPRGFSDMTTEKVPVSQTCGRARVVDVRALVGTTDRSKWPMSPEITAETLRQFETSKGALQAGDVVVLMSLHND